MGQNWERAAMIKARRLRRRSANRRGVSQAAIAPFIWRRNLDFAAIEDIHSIKRQIHAHGGHGEIAVAGHNIKLGRGGIREIEFFAQTQQLILGGRNPRLRAPATLDALEALAAQGVVEPRGGGGDCGDCYRYLRTLEHRLQMIEDEQTHTVPDSEEGLAHIACFMGYDERRRLSRRSDAQCWRRCRAIMPGCSSAKPDLTDAHGNLVFTGVEDDPGNARDPARRWASATPPMSPAPSAAGIMAASAPCVRPRARELLTKLMPAILEALAATADPDAAFVAVRPFSFQPAVRACSFFRCSWPGRNSWICWPGCVGSAPRLATHLAREPATLDALLDAGFPGDAAVARRNWTPNLDASA